MPEEMMETGVNELDVAETAPETDTDTTETSENTQQVAEAVPQSRETNAYFADQRRKQELEQLKQSHAQTQRELEMAKQALGAYFDGETVEEMADRAMAQSKGVEYDAYRQQRLNEERQSAQQARLQSELNFYRQKEIDATIERDIKEIQAIDPTISSLDDISRKMPLYASFRFNTQSPMTAAQAYLAAREVAKQTSKPKPASTGSMTGTGTGENEFFSDAELSKLSKEQLDDPKVMEKAMRSMGRLK